jgi:AcrR family transcriptional regulator
VSEPAPKDGRAARRVETREKIREAAWELFTRDGFHATTTHAIAKRAGVAAGTVFVHASDKEDLLFLVMHERLAEVVDERFRTMPDGPLLDRLLYLFGGLFAMYGEHPDVAKEFVKSLPGADGPNAREMMSLTISFITRLGLLVGEAQYRKEAAPDVDPILAGQNFFALYFMALLAWIGGQATLEQALRPLLHDALALQIRGLRP